MLYLFILFINLWWLKHNTFAPSLVSVLSLLQSLLIMRFPNSDTALFV
jgi:hypothetical protein